MIDDGPRLIDLTTPSKFSESITMTSTYQASTEAPHYCKFVDLVVDSTISMFYIY